MWLSSRFCSQVGIFLAFPLLGHGDKFFFLNLVLTAYVLCVILARLAMAVREVQEWEVGIWCPLLGIKRLG